MADINEIILDKIEAKYWDFPFHINKMLITSYDANDNPLIVEYYKENKLMFTHYLEYDGSGRIIKKEIKIPG